MAEATLAMTQNIIQQEKEAARVIVEQQVACYTGYLFTNDPSYLTEHGSMEPMYNQQQAQKQPPPQREEEQDPTATEKAMQGLKDGVQATRQRVNVVFSKREQEKRHQQRYSGPFVNEIRKRLDAYFAITVRNVRDSVPKAIGFYLVRAVQEKLQFELLNALNQKDRLSELLGEPPHIMEERKTLTNQLKVLQNAYAVLTRDPTLAAIAFEAEDDEVPAPVATQLSKPSPVTAPSRTAQPAPAVLGPRPAGPTTPVAPAQTATSSIFGGGNTTGGSSVRKPATKNPLSSD
jgi:dynamin 1-like protein